VDRVRTDGRDLRYLGAFVRCFASAVGLVLAALVLAAPAAADSRTARDPVGDTKGSHYPGPPYVWSSAHDCWVTKAVQECGEFDYFEYVGWRLDIASVSHAHSGRSVVHRVTMARKWQSNELGSGRGGQISLYFNLDRDGALERRLDLYLRRGKAAGIMRAGSRSVGSVSVTRPNAKTVEVRFPRTSLGAGRVTYRWFAFAGIQCKRKYDRCGDRSPNGALVTHRLG
jgi:hypothetical protein